MGGRNRRLTLAAIALPFLVLAMSGLARAATFTVTNTSDTGVSGDGSLRGEIIAANSASGSNTIQFASGVTGTINLTASNGPLTVTGILTITGPTTSPGITIDGQLAVRVMAVNSGAMLNIANLTIENGSTDENEVGGAGISNGGTLTVTNCTFSGNTAAIGGGGILNNGGLTVTNCTFSGNSAAAFGGGGIANSNTLTVTNSTFSGNTATVEGDGGGINNDGWLTVTNSTFSVNSAAGDGGAIISEDGGAIMATLTVTNSTFSGNSAATGGAIEDDAGTATFTNSTFSGNAAAEFGGGIVGGHGTRLKGTILADESSGNCFGTITDGGYNISDDASCNFTEPPTGTSVNSSTTLNLDPMGLQSHGGPTQTIALESMSQALGFDKDCTDQQSPPQPVFTDQRSFSRPNSPSFCDSGAYEFDGLAPITGTVTGNLTITSGVTVIVGGTVTGNVTQRCHPPSPCTLFASNATIGGNLQIGGDAMFSIDDTTIDGNLQVQNIPPGTAQSEICGSDVKGSLQVHNNGTPIEIGNSSMTCAGNTIGNDLQIQNNTGAVQVYDDTAGGNLQCQSNTSIMGSMDMAKSLQGQCASF